MDTAAAELQWELGRHVKETPQGCIPCQRVVLDNAENVVVDRKVSSDGHCRKFLVGKSHEARENTLQFSHMGHPLEYGKILGEICILLIIPETMKLSSFFHPLSVPILESWVCCSTQLP